MAGPSADRITEWEGGSLSELISMLQAAALPVRIEVIAPGTADSVAGEVHLLAGGLADAFAGSLRRDDAMAALQRLEGARYIIEARLPDPDSGSLGEPGPNQGTLNERPLAALMRYCEDYVLTCRLEVWRGRERAVISYRRGEIISTSVGGSEGSDRLPEVLGWSEGSYEIILQAPVLPQVTPRKREGQAVVARPERKRHSTLPLMPTAAPSSSDAVTSQRTTAAITSQSSGPVVKADRPMTPQPVQPNKPLTPARVTSAQPAASPPATEKPAAQPAPPPLSAQKPSQQQATAQPTTRQPVAPAARQSTPAPPAQAQKPARQQPPQAQKPAQQQPPQAQKPAQQQPLQAQKPAQQQPPQAQKPAQQQPPQAQKPAQQQPPQAQKPAQQQPPQAQKPTQQQPVPPPQPALAQAAAPPAQKLPIRHATPIAAEPLPSELTTRGTPPVPTVPLVTTQSSQPALRAMTQGPAAPIPLVKPAAQALQKQPPAAASASATSVSTPPQGSAPPSVTSLPVTPPAVVPPSTPPSPAAQSAEKPAAPARSTKPSSAASNDLKPASGTIEAKPRHANHLPPAAAPIQVEEEPVIASSQQPLTPVVIPTRPDQAHKSRPSRKKISEHPVRVYVFVGLAIGAGIVLAYWAYWYLPFAHH